VTAPGRRAAPAGDGRSGGTARRRAARIGSGAVAATSAVAARPGPATGAVAAHGAARCRHRHGDGANR
jgi:hypothetical protein